MGLNDWTTGLLLHRTTSTYKETLTNEVELVRALDRIRTFSLCQYTLLINILNDIGIYLPLNGISDYYHIL